MMGTDTEAVLDFLRRHARRGSRHFAPATIGRLLHWSPGRAEDALLAVTNIPNAGLERRYVSLCEQALCSHTWDVTQHMLLSTGRRDPGTTACPVCRTPRTLDPDNLALEFEYLGPPAADDERPEDSGSSPTQMLANSAPDIPVGRVAESLVRQSLATISAATGGSVNGNVINIFNQSSTVQHPAKLSDSEFSVSDDYKVLPPPTPSSLKIDVRGKSEVEGVQVRDGGAEISAEGESKVRSIAVGAAIADKKDPAWSWRSPASIVGVLAVIATIVASLIGLAAK